MKIVLPITTFAFALTAGLSTAYEWRTTFPETKVLRYLTAATDGGTVVLGGHDGGLWSTRDFVEFTDLSLDTNLDITKLRSYGGGWAALASHDVSSGQVGERKLDAVPLFSNDGVHWTVSVPPGYTSESRTTALAGGPEGWVIGTGLVPNQPGPSFTNLPTGLLTGNGATWRSFAFATENTTGSPWASHIDYADGTWLAFSQNGLYRSADARNWETVSGTNGTFGQATRDSAYLNGTWIVVGRNVHASSNNGDTWQGVSTGFTTNGVGAMGGYFVAVGTGGEIAISTNGINWATVRSGGGSFVDNGLNEVIEFKGHAYAVGKGGLIVSSPITDLFNWTVVAGRSKQRSFEIGSFEPGLTHDGTDFIAVSDNQNDFALFSSPDGETWTLEVENTTDNVFSNSVSGGGITLFLGSRTGSGGVKLFRYQNGNLQANNTPFSGSQLAGYANGQFFLNTFTNFSDGSAECIVRTSPDGLNWTQRLTIPLSVGLNYSNDPVEVVFTGTHYYVAFFSDFGATAAHVYRSTDLANWSAVSTNLPPLDGADMAFGSNRFVVTSRDAGTRYSDNGQLYFTASGPPSGGGVDGISRLATNGSRFYGFTEGRMWVSEDGINWGGLVEDQDIRLQSLVAAEGKILALGDEPNDSATLKYIFAAADTALPAPELNFIGRGVTGATGDQAVLVEMKNNPVSVVTAQVKEGANTRASIEFNNSFGGITHYASATIPVSGGAADRTLTLTSTNAQIGSQDTFAINQAPGIATRFYSGFRDGNFSPTQIADGSAAPNADSEPDGVANAFEFLFDLDLGANDASSLPSFQIGPHPDFPGCQQVQLTAPRFLANADIRLGIESSTDLVHFTRLFAEEYVLTPIGGEDAFAALTFSSVPLAGDAARFFRLSATQSGDNGFGGSSGFTGSDDFSAAAIDGSKWQTVFPAGPLPGGLTFAQTNGQIQMTGSAGSGQDGFAALRWNIPLPLAETWQVETAYRSGNISLGNGSRFAGAGIFLFDELDETGLLASFEYARDPAGQLELQAGGQEKTIPGATNNGTLRLTWNADARTLTASFRNSGEFDFSVASVVGDPFDANLTEVNLLLSLGAENATLNQPLALDDFSVTTLRNP